MCGMAPHGTLESAHGQTSFRLTDSEPAPTARQAVFAYPRYSAWIKCPCAAWWRRSRLLRRRLDAEILSSYDRRDEIAAAAPLSRRLRVVGGGGGHSTRHP